ncbi:basement membrane-specific heparan sulfate proteoglycan core, partial [Paramuricea clavata]
MSIHTAVQIIRSFHTDGIKYYDPSLYRLRGEWKVINCDVYNWASVSFVFSPVNKSEKPIKFHLPTKKIKLVSKNVYNVTPLAYKDSGQYICNICVLNTTRYTAGKITRHNLFVLEEGKAYREAEIQKRPNKAYYDIGSNVNLTCEAEKGTNLYKIIWYKLDSQGNLIELKSALNGPGILTLTLNNVSTKDSGRYKCEVFRPQVNYYNSRFVSINVKDAVKYYDPVITRLPGEWKVINCGADWTDAILEFTPIDANATTSSYRRYVDNEKIKRVSKNAFNITRLTYNDSGDYLCATTVMNGTERIPWEMKRYNLIVLNEGKAFMKAKIQKKPNEAHYDNGSSVNLTCEAGKNTNLYKIIWYKLDSQGKSIKKKSALNGPGILTLTLNSLSAKDSGSYKCEVFRPQVNYYNSEFARINVQ